MAGTPKTKTTITDQEILKGYAQAATLADREKELSEALETFGKNNPKLNAALTKTAQVSAPTKEDPNNTKPEERSLTKQIAVANKAYLNAQPEQKAEKRQKMYDILAGALKNKGRELKQNKEGIFEAEGKPAESKAVLKYGEAVVKHLKGEYVGDLDTLKKAADAGLKKHGEEKDVGDESKEHLANKRYFDRLTEIRELANAIAATEALVDERELRLAAIRAMDFLPEAAVKKAGIELTDRKDDGSKQITGVVLNQIGENITGGWWRSGDDGGSGSYEFDADLGTRGATQMVAALINNKGIGKGADIGGIQWTNGPMDARRAAFRTAFALGVEFTFKDTDAYREFVPGQPRPRACNILATMFRVKARQIREENKGVLDHGRVYAEVFFDSEVTGFSPGPKFALGGESAAEVRREFWSALVHTRAGHTGVGLTSKLSKAISKEKTTGRAMVIALRGIHEKLTKMKADDNNFDFDGALGTILDDASKTIGTENLVKIVFSQQHSELARSLGAQAREDIAMHIMTREGKWADYDHWYRYGQTAPQADAIKSIVARSLFEKEIRNISEKLAGNVASADDQEKQKAQKKQAAFLHALGTIQEKNTNSNRVDASKIQEKAYDFEKVEDTDKQILRAQFADKHAKLVPDEKARNRDATIDQHLKNMTQSQLKSLAQVDGCKVEGDDSALNLANYSDSEKQALLEVYKTENPAESAPTEAKLQAMTKAQFKELASKASVVDPEKFKGNNIRVDLSKFSAFEKEILIKAIKLEDGTAATEADLAKMTVSEVENLCATVNTPGANMKQVALDVMIDKALEQAVAKKIADFEGANSGVQVPDNVKTLTPQERAEALSPLVTTVAKSEIALNWTGRTSKNQRDEIAAMVGHIAGRGIESLQGTEGQKTFKDGLTQGGAADGVSLEDRLRDAGIGYSKEFKAGTGSRFNPANWAVSSVDNLRAMAENAINDAGPDNARNRVNVGNRAP